MYYDSVHLVHGSREDLLEEVVIDSAVCVVRLQELAQNGRDGVLHVRTRRLAEGARLLRSACAVLFRLLCCFGFCLHTCVWLRQCREMFSPNFISSLNTTSTMY